MSLRPLIAALDPGSVNHGYAVIDPVKMTVVRNGMMLHPVTMLTKGYDEQITGYRKFLRGLKREGCVILVAERFQSRGLKGLSVELVSFMLALGHTEFPGRTRLIVASQWKNAYGRDGVDLKLMYLRLRPITPHQIDASLIGIWLACRMRSLALPKEAVLHKLIKSSAVVSAKIKRPPSKKAAKKIAAKKAISAGKKNTVNHIRKGSK